MMGLPGLVPDKLLVKSKHSCVRKSATDRGIGYGSSPCCHSCPFPGPIRSLPTPPPAPLLPFSAFEPPSPAQPELTCSTRCTTRIWQCLHQEHLCCSNMPSSTFVTVCALLPPMLRWLGTHGKAAIFGTHTYLGIRPIECNETYF